MSATKLEYEKWLSFHTAPYSHDPLKRSATVVAVCPYWRIEWVKALWSSIEEQWEYERSHPCRHQHHMQIHVLILQSTKLQIYSFVALIDQTISNRQINRYHPHPSCSSTSSTLPFQQISMTQYWNHKWPFTSTTNGNNYTPSIPNPMKMRQLSSFTTSLPTIKLYAHQHPIHTNLDTVHSPIPHPTEPSPPSRNPLNFVQSSELLP